MNFFLEKNYDKTLIIRSFRVWDLNLSRFFNTYNANKEGATFSLARDEREREREKERKNERHLRVSEKKKKKLLLL